MNRIERAHENVLFLSEDGRRGAAPHTHRCPHKLPSGLVGLAVAWGSTHLGVAQAQLTDAASGLSSPSGARVRLESSAIPSPPSTSAAVQPGQWSVVRRDWHWQVWEWQPAELATKAEGPQLPRRFVELASGLNYLDDKGQWQPTREVFEPLADGSFVARHGPHQVVVGPNVNGWAVEVRTPEGAWLRAGPVAEAF